ncbi:hypothetical protein Ancab_013193, partial [Ancistrocladus abbreviatus]
LPAAVSTSRRCCWGYKCMENSSMESQDLLVRTPRTTCIASAIAPCAKALLQQIQTTSCKVVKMLPFLTAIGIKAFYSLFSF